MSILSILRGLLAPAIGLVVFFTASQQARGNVPSKLAPVSAGTWRISSYSWVNFPIPRDFSVECLVRIGNFEIKTNEIAVYAYSDKRPCTRGTDYSFTMGNYWVGAGVYTINVFKDDVLARVYTMTFVDATPERTPVYSLINARTNTYLITADKAERDSLDATLWKTADPGFVAWPKANFAEGGSYTPLAPVSRFYIPSKASHFYTISTDDRALLRTLPNVFVDQGVAFWAVPLNYKYEGAPPLSVDNGIRLCPSTLKPVYRLYNSKRGTHRYTTSPDIAMVMERGLQYENVGGFEPAATAPGQDEDSAWRLEGIAFCVPPG